VDFFVVSQGRLDECGPSRQQGTVTMTKVIQNEDVVAAIEEQFGNRSTDVAGAASDQEFQSTPHFMESTIFAEIMANVRASQIFGIQCDCKANSQWNVSV
jgi:hypothetical protein